MLAVSLSQRHRVDHKQLIAAELHCHDLNRLAIGPVAQLDEAGRPLCPSSWRRRLLEAKTTVLDHMSDAGFRNAVLACGSGKP